jgi:hypothetical protein
MSNLSAMRRLFAPLAAFALVATLLPGQAPVAARPRAQGPDDAVVVAVIDSGFSPYHWDFAASKMPQAVNKEPSDDLPLDQAPHEWLPGFPNPNEFVSYKPLKLSLDDKNSAATLAGQAAKDPTKWQKVQPSEGKKINYYWMPGTKVIGAVDFAGSKINGESSEHGMGTTSSSVGNIHGTCPECLLVFLTLGSQQQGEAAIDWAMKQPWIDVISNSYGFALAYRDRIYNGSSLDLQRKASERGQTIFFSAGNGQDGAFVAPNTTYFSSQEGPDWIITVGAISPGEGEDNHYGGEAGSSHASYSGAGKPADVAGIGSAYPTSYGADEVSGTGNSGFGGTSNATPQVAGIYARSLYIARQAMLGPSRIQKDGVIATGRGFCGPQRQKCEVDDNALTAPELRTRLLHGAVHTPEGVTAAGVGEAPPVREDEFIAEGHGSYFGREAGPKSKAWEKEFVRILAPMFGLAKEPKRPEGEEEWMIVDSWCRQHIWGDWSFGYYHLDKTELPAEDPLNWPVRTQIQQQCPFWQAPP